MYCARFTYAVHIFGITLMGRQTQCYCFSITRHDTDVEFCRLLMLMTTAGNNLFDQLRNSKTFQFFSEIKAINTRLLAF